MAQVTRMSSSKSAGTDGIPPGVLNHLADDILFHWIKYFMLNTWSISKLFVIHWINDPSNYISISNTLPKLYYGILDTRFKAWYKASPEQAGTQPGRVR